MCLFCFCRFWFTVISCSNPGVPANGRREGDDFSFGSRVTYSCEVGFVLDGDRARLCGQDGKWIGDLPACQSKWVLWCIFVLINGAGENSGSVVAEKLCRCERLGDKDELR